MPPLQVESELWWPQMALNRNTGEQEGKRGRRAERTANREQTGSWCRLEERRKPTGRSPNTQPSQLAPPISGAARGRPWPAEQRSHQCANKAENRDILKK